MNTRALMRNLRRVFGAVGRPGLWQVALLLFVWVLTRELLAVGANNSSPQDLSAYYTWVFYMLAHHHLPTDGAWEYPPGAALLLLFVHLFGDANYRPVFTKLMLLCDLGVTVTLVRIGLREERLLGAWLWVVGLAGIGSVVLLRFDLLPTLLVVLAMALSWTGQRQRLYGTLLGVGAAIKIWPVIGLLAASTRRRERGAAILFAVIACTIVFIGTGLFLGDPLTFLTHESSRGLEIEAVAATPWFLPHLLGGGRPAYAPVNDTWELLSNTSHTVATGLHLLMLASTGYIAAWWVRRALAGTVTPPALGRDAAFAALLWYVVLSPVLSLQYMVWLIGMGAVVISSGETMMRRPVALTFIAALVTGRSAGHVLGIHPGADHWIGDHWIVLDTVRNLLLLAAAVDALRRIGLPIRVGAPLHRPWDPRQRKLQAQRERA